MARSEGDKPRLGQHWLQEPKILDQIASYASLEAEDYVLEIGPGLGTLTSRLLKPGCSVLAVEFDEQLATNLPLSFPGKSNLKVVNQDIRKFNFEELPADYKVVTNLPYYISGLFLRVLTEVNNKPKLVVALVQKEVAKKAAASPECGDSNKLATILSYHYRAELGIIVAPKAFRPAPKVHSQVLILNRREEPLFPKVEFTEFCHMVKFAFASPRKTLVNNLAAGLQKSKAEVTELLSSLNFNTEIRAEELSKGDWELLLAALS